MDLDNLDVKDINFESMEEDYDGGETHIEEDKEINDLGKGKVKVLGKKPPRQRKSTSKVWSLFVKLPRGKDGKLHCKCKMCGKTYRCESCYGTGNMRRHMDNCPKIVHYDLEQMFLSKSTRGSMSAVNRKDPQVFRDMGDFSVILAIALILDPRYKMTFVEFAYKKVYGSESVELENVRNKLLSLFNEYMMHSTRSTRKVISNSLPSGSGSHESENITTSSMNATISSLDLLETSAKAPRNVKFALLLVFNSQISISKFSGMASSDKPEIVDRERKDDDKEEGQGGFIDKVKDFIHDIGEKIEEAIGFGKPTADVTGIHIPKINLERADIAVDVLIKNPNPVPIPLIDINYLIESDGRKLISGLIPDAGTIHAHGEETVKIPVSLIYDDIKSTYADIKPGSIIPYKIKVDLIVDVPVFGRLTLPLEKTGEIPIPYKPDIDVEKIKFERFTFEETVAILHVKLENKNDFDLGLNSLDYEVWLSDVSIGGAELSKSTTLDKNGISYIDIPITFRPKDFGSALWDMIRGKGTGYTMKGHIDVNTPFGAMKLPIDKEGGTTRLKKNKEDGGDDDDED
ncbi:hypothetical protein LWI28_012370 [Acer negundo]|uniref:BED-type domain-containing protein n=1 Tax=Acer negundo TaxID=4023 RepID=A0AAD5JDQ9_ACENE|nr:hypothetical protein LWI28_012370 [Acer negundo]